MKTTWTVDYLEKQNGARGLSIFMVGKCRELNKETEVIWVWYIAHGKVIAHPTMRGLVPAKNEEIEKRIIEVLNASKDKQASFVTLQRETGFDFLPMLKAIKHMTMWNQGIRGVVSRTGDVAALMIKG